jgi:acyl-CoA reductase-like NAD-dependent aldehyde dehydrogenase
VAPLSAFILAEIVHEARLPAGVFNLVSGDGPTVGEAIASHPKVDMVSFTGSTRAGRRVAELASKTVKRVALELGGKSPNVILDDADLEAAVRAGVTNCYLNSGQTCSAHTRMLVPRSRHDEAARIAKDAAEKFQLETNRNELLEELRRYRRFLDEYAASAVPMKIMMTPTVSKFIDWSLTGGRRKARNCKDKSGVK